MPASSESTRKNSISSVEDEPAMSGSGNPKKVAALPWQVVDLSEWYSVPRGFRAVSI